MHRRDGPVAHEAASLCELAPLIDRGYPMVRCQTNELIAPISEEGIRADKDRAHALLDNGRKGGFDFAFAARIQDYNLLPMERAAA